MTSATTGTPVQIEVRIAARPETVFALISSAEGIQKWMGRSVVFGAAAGGAFRCDINGRDIASGRVLEVTPPSRVRFSWGWEGAGHPIPPGSSVVEITLSADGAGTLLRLTHSDLPAGGAGEHVEGWKHYTSRLATIATGGDPGPDPWDRPEAHAMADRLEGLLENLRVLVAGATPGAWSQKTAEGWPVGVTAHHVVGHLNLADFAAAVAGGQRSPLADFTFDQITAGNSAHAVEFSAITRAELLAALDAAGPQAVATLRGISDATLGVSQPMAFTGGQPLSARELIEGPLLANVTEHIDNVRAALAR